MIQSAINSNVESIYRRVFEQSQRAEAICEIQMDVKGNPSDFKFVHINQSFTVLTGLMPISIIGFNTREVFSEFGQAGSNHPKRLPDSISNHGVDEFECFLESTLKWFRVKTRVLVDRVVLASFDEITDKKSHPNSRERSTSFSDEYLTILNSMSDGVIYQDKHGRTDFFNKRALEILKLNESQLIGATSYDPHWRTITEDFKEFNPDEHPVQVSLKTGKPMENVIMGITAGNQDYKWISINSSPTFDEERGVNGVIAVFRDITEVKDNQEIIRATRETNEFIFDQVSDAVCILTSEAKYAKVSKSVKKVLGCTPSELIGNSLVYGVHELDREKIMSKFRDVLRGQSECRCSYRFLRAANECIWVETVFKSIQNQKGQTVSVMASIRNIDASKTFERELIRLNNELNRSNEELTDFAYVASHDLQEPLRMVYSFTELLKKEYGEQMDQSALKYMDFAISGARRMKLLIDDLLNYSRVNTMEEGLETKDVREILNGVLLCYQNREDLSNIEINNRLSSCRLAMIPSLIERVFVNLIENSIKFRKKDKKLIVNILSKPQVEGLLILIEDNGIGIDMKFNDKIFKIFQRLHSSESYEGTGIGLAIVKRIIDRHGGKIWVESTKGNGATFCILLPLNNLNNQQNV